MTGIAQRVAMKALITNDEGKVLIIREAAYDDASQVGKYHFPGGRIEPGENHVDGLKREVQEEAGVDVEVEYPLYVGEWQPIIKGTPTQIVAVFMVCRAKSTDVKLGPDADAYEWIDPRDYKKFRLMDPDDKVFEAFLKRKV